MRLGTTVAAVTWALGAASAVEAQQDRAQRIASARAESVYAAALDIYLAAAEPVAIDSLWAVSVYEIAQILRDLDDVPASDTWLRWAARHGPEWPIDPDWFAPSLVAAFQQASAAVAAEVGGIEDVLGPDAVETTWAWPTQFAVGSPGSVVVRARDPSVTLSVTVAGAAGAVGPDVPVTVGPGTHEIVLSADGYEAARLRREVLGGVSTTVTVDLAPVLPPLTQELVSGRLLQLRYLRDGVLRCTNAVSLRDGLALSSLSTIDAATRMDVMSPNRVFENVEIIQSDPDADLAVVRLDGDPVPQTIPTTSPLSTYTWSVYRDGCDGPFGVQRLRVPGGFADISGTLPVGALGPASVGSPVVDLEGRVVGVVVGDGRVAPMSRAEGVVDAAVAQLNEGGFPYAWVGLGVAAAAGAAVYFLKGKGPSGGSSTGGIVIVIPTG